MSNRPLIAEWLAGPLRANRASYAHVALAAALINLFALSTSIFSMTVYDRVVPANAVNSLIALTLGMALVLAFDLTLRTLRGVLIDHAGAAIDREVGEALFARLLTLPLARPRGATGALAGTLREFEPLRDFFTGATLAAVVDVPFIVLFLLAVAAIGGVLVLVPLAMLPLVLGVALAAQGRLGRATGAMVADALCKQAVLVETAGALETVRAVGAGPMMAARWSAAVERAAAGGLTQRRIAAGAINVAGLAQSLSYVGVIVFGVRMVGAGTLSTGALVACSLLAGRAVAPLGGIANLMTRLVHARAAYRSLDRLMRGAAPDAPARSLPTMAAPPLTLERVTFRYPSAPAPALDGVTLALGPGERVGVLGRSGSGKSTLGKLVAGLYPPNAGTVLIGGERAAARGNIGIGVEPQEATLFSGTIRDNILLGRAGLDDAAMLAAATLAGVEAFVGGDSRGYDRTLADRGEGLSGGQRQAIALARALCGDPGLLVLDEPTAAMDAATEAALIVRLTPWLVGRTLVLATHRVSLLALVDRIIVLDRGRIVTDGARDAVLGTMSVRRTAAGA